MNSAFSYYDYICKKCDRLSARNTRTLSFKRVFFIKNIIHEIIHEKYFDKLKLEIGKKTRGVC